VLAVPLLAVVGLLAGCSAAGSSPAAGPAEDRGEVAPVPASGEVPGDVGSSLDRKIARTATISLVIDDVAATAAQLRGVAQSVGGIVTDELLQLPVPDDASRPWGTTSTVVLSVPATALDRTLDLAAGLGEVTDRTISSTDVTDEVVDVDARVTTMRESIARLQELMDRAGSVSEIARVESELTSRQAELESLLARQKALSAMVETSPVTVTLTPRAIAVPKAPDGFLSGLAAGCRHRARRDAALPGDHRGRGRPAARPAAPPGAGRSPGRGGRAGHRAPHVARSVAAGCGAQGVVRPVASDAVAPGRC
jgi:hypothetical protein